MPDPICGGDLQRAARNIAIFQIVWNILFVVLIVVLAFVFGITAFGLHLKDHDDSHNATIASSITVKTSGSGISVENGTMEDDVEIAGFFIKGARAFGSLGVMYLVYCVILIIVAGILLKGANEKNLKCTLGWLEFTVIVGGGNLFGLITKIYNGVWVMSFLTLVDNFLTVYFIWVVWTYYKQLKKDQTSPANVNWNVDEGAKV